LFSSVVAGTDSTPYGVDSVPDAASRQCRLAFAHDTVVPT